MWRPCFDLTAHDVAKGRLRSSRRRRHPSVTEAPSPFDHIELRALRVDNTGPPTHADHVDGWRADGGAESSRSRDRRVGVVDSEVDEPARPGIRCRIRHGAGDVAPVDSELDIIPRVTHRCGVALRV